MLQVVFVLMRLSLLIIKKKRVFSFEVHGLVVNPSHQVALGGEA